MKALDHANQALTFFLELAVYASLVAWAVGTSLATWGRVLLAVAAVVVFAVMWGVFAAPRASMPLHGAGRLAFEIAWFGLGVAALRWSDLRQWAIPLAAVLVVNGALRAAFAST